MRGLKALGFSTLEAECYVVLSEAQQPLTGYQVAKRLGTPRANVYDALHHLHQTGAVLKRTHEGVSHFWPVPFDVLADRVLREMRQQVGALAPLFQTALPTRGVWEGRGLDVFAREAAAVLRDARKEIALGASRTPVAAIAPALADVARRNTVAIHAGCWSGCPETGCGACPPPVRALMPLRVGDPCVVVVDRAVAVVTSGHSRAATVLVTDNRPVVEGLRRLIRPEGVDGQEDVAGWRT